MIISYTIAISVVLFVLSVFCTLNFHDAIGFKKICWPSEVWARKYLALGLKMLGTTGL